MDKKVIKEKYNEYIKKNGRSPLYVEAQIQWKDDKNTAEVLFKLNDEYDEKDDEEVFFSCHGIEDFMSTLEDECGEDFIITDVFGFE
jgi:hypothetical protein